MSLPVSLTLAPHVCIHVCVIDICMDLGKFFCLNKLTQSRVILDPDLNEYERSLLLW